MSGQTHNRDEAIERFKSGEVNVFLISLKTGGDKEESLKLTAEDLTALFEPL
jgi:hypothetical protein